jgi:ABC-type multidrug transport system permease subunit
LNALNDCEIRSLKYSSFWLVAINPSPYMQESLLTIERRLIFMSNAKIVGVLLVIAGMMIGGVPLVTALFVTGILLAIAKLVSGNGNNSNNHRGFF